VWRRLSAQNAYEFFGSSGQETAQWLRVVCGCVCVALSVYSWGFRVQKAVCVCIGTMESDRSSDDECDDSKPPNAFDDLMQPPSKRAKVEEVDPIYIAVIYIRWLRWIDPSAPLYNVPYIGQAVRSKEKYGDATNVALQRWNEENRQAIREHKEVGLIACIEMYGHSAFFDEVVDFRIGIHSCVQNWADEEERRMISFHGGPFRFELNGSPPTTLNLTEGGKGANWKKSMLIFHDIAWRVFQKHILEHIETNGTALVSDKFIAPDGYKLGSQCSSVRRETFWKGHPRGDERVKWLESLPGWTFDVKSSDEWKASVSNAHIESWASKTEEEHHTAIENMRKAQNEPDLKCRKSEWAKRAWTTKSEDELKQWKCNIANSAKDRSAETSAFFTELWKDESHKELMSKSMAKRWTDVEKRAELVNALTASAQSKERREKQSVISKKLMLKEAEEGKVPLWMRAHESREQKRQCHLSQLTASERRVAETEHKRNKAKYQRDKLRLAALRTLPAWSNSTIKSLSNAKKDGVVFFQDPIGVWCARMGTQGGAGSSAEHASAPVEKEVAVGASAG